MENIPVIILLGGFGLYATLRAFEGKFFEVGPYLSPFYSPLIDASHHWWRFSPALLILAFPLGFRVTCYYYRKAYYRAFFLDPPGCAVGEPAHRNYRGETGFPFVLQNLHRYFLYGAHGERRATRLHHPGRAAHRDGGRRHPERRSICERREVRRVRTR